MTEPTKPAAAKPAAKKPAPKAAPKTTAAPRKPIVPPAVTDRVRAIPNLTSRIGTAFYDWLRNR
jgi:hypothetical protein